MIFWNYVGLLDTQQIIRFTPCLVPWWGFSGSTDRHIRRYFRFDQIRDGGSALRSKNLPSPFSDIMTLNQREYAIISLLTGKSKGKAVCDKSYHTTGRKTLQKLDLRLLSEVSMRYWRGSEQLSDAMIWKIFLQRLTISNSTNHRWLVYITWLVVVAPKPSTNDSAYLFGA